MHSLEERNLLCQRPTGSGYKEVEREISQTEYYRIAGNIQSSSGVGLAGRVRRERGHMEWRPITLAKASPFSRVPPWLSPEANIDVSFIERKKEWQINEVGIIIIIGSMYLNEKYYNDLKMYTDGSKKQECVGIGAYIPKYQSQNECHITYQFIQQKY